ncbi:hypothetical protein OEA41_005303 [Lepraria neglecta]|uniref:Uncharacterized protein n=1 Tax=Lepraria neglecta TaxID=209136 RepID=A0AAD9Z0A1_9LECA|nr:hypothetical protein OEA41_005303 [Lepraria neglecta]
MRTSAFLAVPAFTALALAQTGSNPALSYITQTNSLGVPTGQPLPVTTQPKAVTTQPAVATGPATGPGSTLVVVPSGGSGSGSGGTNGTVSTGKLGATSTSSTGGSTATSSSGSSTSSGTGSSDAGLLEPMLGLGFAGVLFAAFL